MKTEERSKVFSSLPVKFGIGLTLTAEIILFSQLSPYFFTAENILNVSLQLSITAIIAAGMTFVILTSGIDLSVGALVAFTGVVAASVAKLALPVLSLFRWPLQLGCLSGQLPGYLQGYALHGMPSRRLLLHWR